MTAQREEWRLDEAFIAAKGRHRPTEMETLCVYCVSPWPCDAFNALKGYEALLAQLDEAEVREGELRAALEAVNPGLIADRVLLLIKEATEARDAALAKGKP